MLVVHLSVRYINLLPPQHADSYFLDDVVEAYNLIKDLEPTTPQVILPKSLVIRDY